LLREQKDINLLSAHVAFQHHERYDGGGYPRLLKKNEICEYARILAIADLFDALTSDNKHRKSFSVTAALEIIKKAAGQQIDQDLTKMFVENVALYSTGQLVELNTGEVAVVTANSSGRAQKPRIKVILDSEKRLVKSFADLSIVRAIEDEDFCTRITKLFEGK